MSYDLSSCCVSQLIVESPRLTVKEGTDDHPAAQLLVQRADQAATDTMTPMVLTHDDVLDVGPTHPVSHRAREGNDLLPAPASHGRSRLEESRELTLVALGPPSLFIKQCTNGGCWDRTSPIGFDLDVLCGPPHGLMLVLESGFAAGPTPDGAQLGRLGRTVWTGRVRSLR